MANLLLTMQQEQRKRDRGWGTANAQTPPLSTSEGPWGGRLDSIITLRLYPKSYLKISFTTRELINVNISRRSSLTGTTTTATGGMAAALKPTEGRQRTGDVARARGGYTLSSLKCVSTRERWLDKK